MSNRNRIAMLRAADQAGGDGDIHIFEAAGLGKAPFKVTGCTQAQNACQFCGTPILYNYHIAGADGAAFIVGSECVKKTGDAGLINSVKGFEARRRKDNELSARRELEKLIAERGDEMKPLPHPFGNRGGRSGGVLSLLDYAVFVSKYAGKPATLSAIERINAALQEVNHKGQYE